MTARLALVPVLLALLGGCAVPSWVPLIGSEEPAGRGSASRAPGTGIREAVKVPASGTIVNPHREDDDRVVDRIVAVVNNDAITLAEIQESIVIFRHENRDRASVSDEELTRQFLSRLIDTRLQLQEAEREKIPVDETEVDEELAARMKKLGANKPEDYEAVLRAQGVTLEAVRKRLRDTLRVARLVRRKVALRVSVTDAEVDRYIEENRARLETGLTYHARHILVVPEAPTDAGWEAARIRADLVRTRLAEGADFAEMARQYSKDASARDGGDLGTLTRGELTQEIEAQILALEPGQVSAPYRSPLGFHIFRLESKETLDGNRRERVRQQVKDILFRQRYEVRLDEWLKSIRQRQGTIIEIRM